MQNQKFLNFWGWPSLPWNEPIGLDRLYWQEQTEMICSRLLFSLSRAASLFVIAAPPGHGKSTLARWLYHRIETSTHDVALFSLMQHETKGDWLIPRLAHYLGMDLVDHNQGQVIQRLHEASLQDKVLTVILDDAHKISTAEAFDEILALTHMQALVPNRINFVLIGNPRLMQTLQSMDGIQHRLALWAGLEPLTATELSSYLSHRLETLQLPQKTLQTDALASLAQFGIGSFAAIDSVLETCLLEAFLRDQRTINADVMATAMQFIGLPKAGEDLMGEAFKSKAAARRRGPTSAKSAGSATARDLNSLYYKGDGGHDPEQS